MMDKHYLLPPCPSMPGETKVSNASNLTDTRTTNSTLKLADWHSLMLMTYPKFYTAEEREVKAVWGQEEGGVGLSSNLTETSANSTLKLADWHRLILMTYPKLYTAEERVAPAVWG